jgi:hypothetical protein
MKHTHDTKEKGFVVLYAVLVSSVLLYMALAISGIAYKEQLLSVNTKSSQYSFIAADTGMECALYNDIKLSIFPIDGSLPGTDFECNGGSISAENTFTIPVYKVDVPAMVNTTVIPGCAVVTINKNYDSDDDGTLDATRIDSRGYNLSCANIVYNTTGDISFLNGSGSRAVERLLTAIYSNSSGN